VYVRLVGWSIRSYLPIYGINWLTSIFSFLDNIGSAGRGRRRCSEGAMLTMRLIGVRDYNVFEDGQRIGRIRLASERPAAGSGKCKSTSRPAVRQRHDTRRRQAGLQGGMAGVQREARAGKIGGGLSRREHPQRTMTWSKQFFDPIILPDGRKLTTLRDAATLHHRVAEGGARRCPLANRDGSAAAGRRA
jgi:hypothetical protein